MNDLQKQYGTSFILHQALCTISNPSVNSNWSYSPETPNSGKNWRFFVPRDLEIRWMTLKNKRAPLLDYIKLCVPFQSHRWSQTGVTVRKPSVWVKLEIFLSIVTLKFDGWPWETIGRIFYTTLSIVRHFKAIGKFKLEGQNWRFLSCVTLKNDRWPWKTIGHLSYAFSSFVHHSIAIGEFKLELQSGNPQFGSKSTIF